MFGIRVGGGAAAHRRLETVKDGTQACAREGGKEREGGRARLGKSEGGGGRKGGRQWKNCEMCLVKPFFRCNTNQMYYLYFNQRGYLYA